MNRVYSSVYNVYLDPAPNCKLLKIVAKFYLHELDAPCIFFSPVVQVTHELHRTHLPIYLGITRTMRTTSTKKRTRVADAGENRTKEPRRASSPNTRPTAPRKLTIECLPDDVLAKVFTHADVKTIGWRSKYVMAGSMSSTRALVYFGKRGRDSSESLLKTRSRPTTSSEKAQLHCRGRSLSSAHLFRGRGGPRW